MFKYFISLFIVVFLFTSPSSEALEVNNLYQANIAVDSQTSKQRNIAIKKAMQAVVLKVGGTPEVLDDASMRKAMNNAASYLSQYYYQTQSSQGNSNQLTLVVKFNESKVNQLFQQADLAIWGSIRPQILLWLIDENGFERTILSNASASPLIESSLDFSTRRGLPLLFPLMDLDDASQINLTDIWGRFVEPIRDASSRYAPEAIVVMRVSNSSLLDSNDEDDLSRSEINDSGLDCGLLCTNDSMGDQYVLDWIFISPKEGEVHQSNLGLSYQGDNKVSLLTQGLSDITSLIYQQYALTTTENNRFILDIANVTSLTQDHALYNFLSELSAVKEATLVSVNGTTRRYDLSVIGSKTALLAALELNKKLKQEQDEQQFFESLPEADPDAVPLFYWEPK